MRHDDILQCMDSGLAYLSSLVAAQAMDSLKQDLPYLLKVDSVCLLLDNREITISCTLPTIVLTDLLGCVVGHVLEHADSDQVVVDIASSVTCVHVDGVEHRDEVCLTKPVDVIADD